MEKLDKWWAQSPYECRPDIPTRDEEHVPVDLQFQRTAHDPNLGKQTSDLMRLSPVYYQRFGSDISLGSHLSDKLDGMWEYLDGSDYRAPRALADVWAALEAPL